MVTVTSNEIIRKSLLFAYYPNEPLVMDSAIIPFIYDGNCINRAPMRRLMLQVATYKMSL